MKISKIFGGRFLSASDLVNWVGLDVDIPVTLDEVVRDEVYSRNDRKKVMVYVVRFIGKDKGVILKPTNARKLAELCGDETDHWRGQRVNMRAEMVNSFGDQVAGIRFYPAVKPGDQKNAEEIDVPDVPPDADLHPLMDEGEEEDVDVEDVTADDDDEENDRRVDSYSPSHFAIR